MDGQDGAAVAGSALSPSGRLRLFGTIAVVAAAASIAVIAVAVGSSSPGPTPRPTSSSTPTTPVPMPTAPRAASSESDVFDGWAVDAVDAARFDETTESRTGRAALHVTDAGGGPSGVVSTISQTVVVAQRSRVEASFWATSVLSSSPAGAVEFRIGGGSGAVVALPAGAFGWTRFTVAWEVPAGVTSMPIDVIVTGAPADVRFDDVSVQGQGSRGVVVTNGGFDTSSAAISIVDGSLVLERSDVLHLESTSAPDGSFTWTAREYTGGPAVSGEGRLIAGAATLPLKRFPDGYYDLAIRVRTPQGPVQRSTDLVVTEPPPVSATTPLMGVGVHLGTETDAQLAQKIGDLAALGVRSARTDADWASIERQPGRYDFASLDRVVGALERAGLRPLLIPGYSNPLYDGGRTPSSAVGIAAFARFAAAVAARYPNADIDVYNEFDWRFNTGSCGTTPACYLALLRPAAAAVRAAGTTAAVAGPDISGNGVQQEWLNGFIGDGGLGSIDALDLHPYVQPARPDVLDDQLDTLRAAMAAGGGEHLPIWFTEFGDATVPGGVTERQQAEDLARVFGVAASHDVTRVYWYDAIDDGQDRSNPEDNFGLFRTPTSFAPEAFVPKPAAAVLATTVRFAAEGAGVPDAGPATSTTGGLRTVRFGSGAASVAVSWAATPMKVSVAGGRRVVTMTGRSESASRLAIGSSPVWTLSGTTIRQ